MQFKMRYVAGAAMAAALIATGLGAALTSSPAFAQQATAPITKGQKIVMATHSFNVFISTDPDRPAPTRTQAVVPGGAAVQPASATAPAQAPAAPGTPLLTKLTNEAGITGQEFLAVQMIGGSTPM